MSSQAVKVKSEESRGNGGVTGALPGPIEKVVSYPRRFRRFLHEVRVEMKQVTWPTREDIRATTVVVIATVFFFGFFLFLVDKGVSEVVQRVFRYFGQ